MFAYLSSSLFGFLFSWCRVLLHSLAFMTSGSRTFSSRRVVILFFAAAFRAVRGIVFSSLFVCFFIAVAAFLSVAYFSLIWTCCFGELEMLGLFPFT